MDENYDQHVQAVKALEKAEELYSSMEYDDMYGPIMECLEMDPDLGRGWELNGMVMFYYGDLNGARSSFNEAVSRKGHYPEAKWALTLMNSDKWPTGQDPSSEVARYTALGERLLNDRIWKGAALCFNKLSEIVQPTWRIHSIMGLIYREMDRLESSLDEYLKASEMEDAPPEIQYDLSTVLIKMGRFGDAEDTLIELIESIGPSSPLLNNLGAALEAQGRDDEAMPLYEDAIEMDPKYYPALYSKGRLLQKKGKMEEAKEVMQQALESEGRVFDRDDVDGREEREKSDDVHVKEVMIRGRESGP